MTNDNNGFLIFENIFTNQEAYFFTNNSSSTKPHIS